VAERVIPELGGQKVEIGAAMRSLWFSDWSQIFEMVQVVPEQNESCEAELATPPVVRGIERTGDAVRGQARRVRSLVDIARSLWAGAAAGAARATAAGRAATRARVAARGGAPAGGRAAAPARARSRVGPTRPSAARRRRATGAAPARASARSGHAPGSARTAARPPLILALVCSLRRLPAGTLFVGTVKAAR
jgi:hypothetical protein